jgi:hypothetical protein
MEFTVEFYETTNGRVPVQEFLDELKASDPGDFASVLAGLAKLRNRQYHREPLSKALNDGLFELRHVGKLNTRVLWFFMKGRRIIAFATKARPSRRATSTPPANGCGTGANDLKNENEL